MNRPILGIDISKLKFNVCLLKANGKLKHKVFPNTFSGFEQLSLWLSQHDATNAHACLEATGTYGEALALFLTQTEVMVSVVNPAAVKAFAGAGLSRTKNDKVDAELIARFCLSQQPTAWRPPPPEIHQLQALVRRVESLIEMRVWRRKSSFIRCFGGCGAAKFGATYCVSEPANQTNRTDDS